MLLWKCNQARNWPLVSEVTGFGWDTSLFCCHSPFPSVEYFLAIWKAALTCSQFFSLDKIIFQAYPLWFPRGAVKQRAKPHLDKNYSLWGFVADARGKMVFQLHLWAHYLATPQTSLRSWDKAAWTGFLFCSCTHYILVSSTSQCLIWHKWSALSKDTPISWFTYYV